MASLFQDIKFAIRTLRRSPGFFLIALFTLALAIGSNTAIFSVLKVVLLKPISYANSDRIMLIWSNDARTHNSRGQVSATEIEDVRRQSTTLENVTVFADWTPTLSGIGDSERLAATQVGDGFFAVLGAKPLMGRFFTPGEQIDGKDRVVVLSYGLWKKRFGGDPNILGKMITLSTVPHEIIGVLPQNFRALPSTLVDGGQLYRPVAEAYDPTKRAERHLRAIARLKPGVAPGTAMAEVAAISQRLAQSYPKDNGTIRHRAVSLYEDSVSNLRATVYVLCGAVLLLLLIACANVANLLLARATSRQREIAVRSALGAGRARLLAQSGAESMVLSIAAGALGLLFAYWGTRALALFGAKVSSQFELISIDPAVMLFCLAATLLTGLLFGLAPAAQMFQIPVSEALKGAGRGASHGHSRLRNGLMVAEVAMAVVMLVCAGLLVKSFHRLLNVDPGFDPKGTVAMNVWLPFAKYKTPELQTAAYRKLLTQLEGTPGMRSAALVNNPPMANFDGRVFLVEGESTSPNELPEAQFGIVTPQYPQTMGIPLVAGRIFNDGDTETSLTVAMVNKKFVGEHFRGQDPIGKRVQVLSGAKQNGQYLWRTIVGVVGDVKHHGLDHDAMQTIYVPFVQMPVSWMTLVARATGDPKQLIGPLRAAVKQVDPDVAPFHVSTYEEILGDTVATRKFALLLVSGFGFMALALGCVGIYGVISYSVSQRTQEIGIRMALGAQRANILRAVLTEGLRFTFAGLLIGSLLAFLASKTLESLLYEVKPGDLSTFVLIACLLTISALAASLIPARRATKVDPMVALRYE